MKIYVGGRCSGKTTKVIEYMNTHPNTVVITYSLKAKEQFPKELQKRVINYSDNNIKGLSLKEVIIDEIDAFNDNALTYLQAAMVTNGSPTDIIKMVTTTPFKSWNNRSTTLRALIRNNNNEYEVLPTFHPELNMFKKSLSEERFWVEAFGYMKSDNELLREEIIKERIDSITKDLNSLKTYIG